MEYEDVDAEYEDLEIDPDEEEEDDEDDDDESLTENTQLTSLGKQITGKNRTYLPRMTSYEFARVIGVRSNQIDYQSPVGINTSKTSSIEISEEELRGNKCPLYLGRPSGDGSKTEIWHTNELVKIDVGLKLRDPTPIQNIKNLTIDEILNFGGSFPTLRAFSQQEFEEVEVLPTPTPISATKTSAPKTSISKIPISTSKTTTSKIPVSTSKIPTSIPVSTSKTSISKIKNTLPNIKK